MISGNFSIIHLSDLHFGRIESNVLHALESFFAEKKSELRMAILTGDLTQRAKKAEFEEAVHFVKALPCPLFLIPGNHDVPLYNLFLRFFRPYKKFLRYLGPFAKNTFEDQDIAVFGLWTLDRFTVKDGKLHGDDLAEAETFFKKSGEGKLRIIASHHPIEKFAKVERIKAVRPHLILSGHEHQSEVRGTGPGGSYPVILAAGTTTSTRVRKEANSFNLISVNEFGVTIEIYGFSKDEGRFVPVSSQTFPDFGATL